MSAAILLFVVFVAGFSAGEVSTDERAGTQSAGAFSVASVDSRFSSLLDEQVRDLWQNGQLTFEFSLNLPDPGDTNSLTACYDVGIPEHDICIDIHVSQDGIVLESDHDCRHTVMPTARGTDAIDVEVNCTQRSA